MMEKIPAYEGNEPYIFVSYAHKDSSVVFDVINNLFKDKYRVWYDQGIAPGSEWPHNIASHLENADTVVFFSSNNSIASINCENELVRAKELNKNIFVYKLDQSNHQGLKNYKHVDDKESLIKLLNDSLIGDGISGYEHINEKSRRSFLWDIIFGFALLLVLGLGISLYGLNKGWFDNYLPARQVTDTINQQPDIDSADTINNDILAQAILSGLGKDDLMEEIHFDNEDDLIKFCETFGYDYVNSRPTYFDLTNDHRQEVYMFYANDEMICLLKYYPELKHITIESGNISSLKEINNCPYLQLLTLNYDLFPIDIPDDIHFEIEIKN